MANAYFTKKTIVLYADIGRLKGLLAAAYGKGSTNTTFRNLPTKAVQIRKAHDKKLKDEKVKRKRRNKRFSEI